MGSVMPILLTVLLVIAGGCGCFLLPEITAPLLALLGIYLVWKIWRFQNENESMKRQLQKILEILEKEKADSEKSE